VEEVVDGVPNLPRRRARCHDDTEELGGDRAIDLGEHGVVVTHPVGVGHSGGGVASPMTWAVRP
jgi:hypothetical protein